MNQNPTATTTTTEVPLHILLRRRREELSLFQAQIAAVLHVTPECIGQWECGRRRMELSKIPRSSPCGYANRRPSTNLVRKTEPSTSTGRKKAYFG